MKHLLLTIVCLIAWTTLPAQDMRQDTYCNPLNIDYTYMIYNSDPGYFLPFGGRSGQ